MSQRTRTVQWCEGRILEILGRVKHDKYPTPLALSAMSMNEIRNHDEQANYDLALLNLLKSGLIKEDYDEKGFKILKLVA
jgi:hypothetical protein